MTRRHRSTRLAATLATLALLGSETLSAAPVWTQASPTATPGALAGHRLAYDAARGVVVLFGGDDGAGFSSATWEYDGSAWVPGPAAPPALEARAYHAMAYDAGRSVTVLYGGTDLLNFFDDTFEYDGTAWTEIVPATTVPPGRVSPAMAFDSSRGVTVMFGGYTGAYPETTYEWNGSDWSGTLPATRPVGRYTHAMAFDGTRILLFGGSDASGTSLQDTWAYDGVWTPLSPNPRPPARIGHDMALDTARQRVVLFGGDASGSSLDDTWEWDGAAWIAGSAAPPALTPRYNVALAHDSGRGVTVMFGGESPRHDETWEYGCGFITIAPPTLPSGRVGRPYGLTLTASGGTAPYTYAVTFGTLPPGLALTPGGFLSGTPTVSGTYAFTVGTTDAFLCQGSIAYALVVDPCPAITLAPASLPAGQQLTPYSQTLTASGGQAPYTFTLTAGALPPGLSLSAAGVISGTPTTPGSYPFDVTATEVFGCTGTASYTLVISPCPTITITPATLPDGRVGATYAQTLTATGGAPPHTFTLTGGTLPAGLTLSPAGLLSGTPTLPGSFSFAITATDAYGCAGSRAYTLRIAVLVDFLVGEGLGQPNPNVVRVFDGSGVATATTFAAYNPNAWGVNVFAGNVDADPYDEILTGPGPGDQFGPQCRGFRRDGSALAKVNFYAYGTLRFGLNVTSPDLDADAFDEIVTGPGPGDVFGPHVRGWQYDGSAIASIGKISFYAYGTLRYGVNVARGELEGDGFDEMLTGPGPGSIFGAIVRGFNYDDLAVTPISKVNFLAFAAYQYGVNVAGGGVDADAFDEIVVAPGPGPTYESRFVGFDFDGVAVALLPGFDVTAYPTLYGGRPGLGDVDQDGVGELLTGAGRDPAADATVQAYDYTGIFLVPLPSTFLPFTGTYGVNVTGGAHGY